MRLIAATMSAHLLHFFVSRARSVRLHLLILSFWGFFMRKSMPSLLLESRLKILSETRDRIARHFIVCKLFEGAAGEGLLISMLYSSW